MENQLDRAARELERKHAGRMERLKVVRAAIGAGAEISADEVNRMVERQYNYLKLLGTSKIIREFIDPEEMLIREFLSRM